MVSSRMDCPEVETAPEGVLFHNDKGPSVGKLPGEAFAFEPCGRLARCILEVH